MANAANAINATLYEKLDFNFMRDIARVAGASQASPPRKEQRGGVSWEIDNGARHGEVVQSD
jgi:hypothetical protein